MLLCGKLTCTSLLHNQRAFKVSIVNPENSVERKKLNLTSEVQNANFFQKKKRSVKQTSKDSPDHTQLLGILLKEN